MGLTASLALLIALGVIGLRTPQYLRGKYLESELLPAKRVYVERFARRCRRVSAQGLGEQRDIELRDAKRVSMGPAPYKMGSYGRHLVLLKLRRRLLCRKVFVVLKHLCQRCDEVWVTGNNCSSYIVPLCILGSDGKDRFSAFLIFDVCYPAEHRQ